MQAARGASLNPSDTATRHPSVPSRRRHLVVFAAIAVTAYAVDVVTKILAVRHLEGEPAIPLVGDLLSLYLTHNSGAAFSFLTGHTEVLAVIAVIAAAAVLWFARRLGSTGWAVALGFLLAGVAGNLTDRIFREPGFMRGHVVDFLMLPNFPVFNVADICINIAAGLIILQALRGVNVDGTRHADAESAAATGPDGDVSGETRP